LPRKNRRDMTTLQLAEVIALHVLAGTGTDWTDAKRLMRKGGQSVLQVLFATDTWFVRLEHRVHGATRTVPLAGTAPGWSDGKRRTTRRRRPTSRGAS
jgi:hypothetical protein